MKWYNYSAHYSSDTGCAEGRYLQTFLTSSHGILFSFFFWRHFSGGDISSSYQSNKAMQISGAPQQHFVISQSCWNIAFPSLKQDSGCEPQIFRYYYRDSYLSDIGTFNLMQEEHEWVWNCSRRMYSFLGEVPLECCIMNATTSHFMSCTGRKSLKRIYPWGPCVHSF